MTILRIEHVQLAMPPGGEDQARRFYVGVLGLTEVPKPADLAGRGGCWFEAPDVKLHLGVDADFWPARKAHPALVVSGLDAMLTRTRAAGCDVEGPEPVRGDRQAYVCDPFGNRIELLEPMG